jgi:hypothetical protein
LKDSFRTRPFVVSACVVKTISEILVESGATGSFVSTDLCRRYGLVPKTIKCLGD